MCVYIYIFHFELSGPWLVLSVVFNRLGVFFLYYYYYLDHNAFTIILANSKPEKLSSCGVYMTNLCMMCEIFESCFFELHLLSLLLKSVCTEGSEL